MGSYIILKQFKYSLQQHHDFIAAHTGVPKKEDESIAPLFIGRF
jgi:hypothetical protein